MRKTAFALAACVAALAGATAARADSFLPAGSTMQFTGPVTLGSGPVVLTCTLTLTVVTNAAGNDADVTAASLAGPLCATLPPGNFNWNVDVVAPIPPPTNITATQIKASGVLVGSCGPGDLVGYWGTSGPTITLPAGTMLGTCSVRGTLTQSSGSTLAITN